MKGVLFTGLQASGKSTCFLQNFYRTHLRLNMDMLKTRHRESILFDACLKAKQPVVIDNTNPTKDERAQYIGAFKEHKFEITGYYFSSCLQDCLDRNSSRNGKEKISDIGILSTHKKIELPHYSEGFDTLFYVSIKDNEFITKEWKDKIS